MYVSPMIMVFPYRKNIRNVNFIIATASGKYFAAAYPTKNFITSNSKDKSMWMAKGQRLLPIPVYIINDCGQASHCMPLRVAGVYGGHFIILPFLLSLRNEKEIIQMILCGAQLKVNTIFQLLLEVSNRNKETWQTERSLNTAKVTYQQGFTQYKTETKLFTSLSTFAYNV